MTKCPECGTEVWSCGEDVFDDELVRIYECPECECLFKEIFELHWPDIVVEEEGMHEKRESY